MKILIILVQFQGRLLCLLVDFFDIVGEIIILIFIESLVRFVYLRPDEQKINKPFNVQINEAWASGFSLEQVQEIFKGQIIC